MCEHSLSITLHVPKRHTNTHDLLRNVGRRTEHYNCNSDNKTTVYRYLTDKLYIYIYIPTGILDISMIKWIKTTHRHTLSSHQVSILMWKSIISNQIDQVKATTPLTTAYKSLTSFTLSIQCNWLSQRIFLQEYFLLGIYWIEGRPIFSSLILEKKHIVRWSIAIFNVAILIINVWHGYLKKVEYFYRFRLILDEHLRCSWVHQTLEKCPN